MAAPDGSPKSKPTRTDSNMQKAGSMLDIINANKKKQQQLKPESNRQAAAGSQKEAAGAGEDVSNSEDE